MKRAEFRLRPLALALRNAGILVFAAALAPQTAIAQVPSGGVVTQGLATITTASPTQQRITQGSDKAVINWQNFSIGAGNSVVFVQPGSTSVVLNRVVSGTPSSILGGLSANGQVFLVNPNGVYFGPNSVVDVAGIVATTLNIRDSDFMAGRYIFSRDPSSPSRATVINDGVIRATPGGYVVLAGDYAANNGIVEARLGTAILAAAGKFTLDITGDSLINFAVNEQTLAQLAGVSNTGQVLADGGRVVMTASVARDLSATVVNNTGIVQAQGTTERDGAIYLTADGGDVVSSGRLDASGARGGQIVAQAQNGTTLISGTVNASGSSGAGGKVQLLGERVGLIDNAAVDASGSTAGGTVLIGGDYQGKNAAVQNAQRTYVGPDAQIKADARDNGDGGKVIVWSDDITRYYGSISARGGAQSGNGGFAEVSGHDILNFSGTVDTRAPMGLAGTLLLDPTEITIEHATPDVSISCCTPPFTYTSSGAPPPSVLSDSTINTQLNLGNVTVLTSSGDIVVSNLTGAVAIAPNPGPANANTLILNSSANISWNSAWSYTNNGQLTLNAGNGTITGSGALAITGAPLLMQATTGIGTSGAPILTTGVTGLVATTGTGGIFVSNSGSGSIDVTSASGVNGITTTTSGDIQVSNSAGGIAVSNIVKAASSGNVTLTTTGAGNNIAVNSGGAIGSANNNVLLSSGGAITQSGGGTITANQLALKAAAGAIGAAGASALQVTANNLTAQSSGGAFVTDSAGGLTVGGVTIGSLSGVSTTAGNSAIEVTTSGGTLTISQTVQANGSGNISLTSNGANNIVVNAGVGGASNNVFLNSGGAITGSGTVTADGLALKTGTGGIGSSGTPLAISANKVAAQAPAGIFISKSAGALAIGGVGISGSPTGISTTGANGDISVTAQGITVNENILTNGSGTVTLNAGTGTLATASGVKITTTGGVTLTADTFTLDPASLISGSIAGTGTSAGIVTLQTGTAGRNFSLGAGTTGSTAGLSGAELLTMGTTILRIGSSTNTAGTVTFDGDLTLTANQGALSINSTGAVTQAANTKIVTPGGFAAQTGSGSITLTEANNDLRTVAISTTGNVNLRNNNSFTVATVDRVTGISAANITLTTGQVMTGDVTAVDTLTFATPPGFAAGDRIRITGGGTDFVATVQSVGGNTVTISQNLTTGTLDTTAEATKLTVASTAGLAVGDVITIAGAGSGGSAFTTTVAALPDATTVTLATAAFTSVSVAAQVFKGRPATATVAGVTVTRLPTTGTTAPGSTTLTVASTNGLAAGDRIVVPGAGVNGSDLVTSITGVGAGSVTLATAASTAVSNAFIAKPSFIGGPATTGTVTAGSTSLTVASSAGYQVGDKILVAGAGASGANYLTTITAVVGNTLTLAAAAPTAVTAATVVHTDQGLNATGTITLQSNLPGGFTQTGGSGNTSNPGNITASNLVLKGYGPFNLAGIGSSNDVGTLVADVTGSISYADRNALTIGGPVGGVTGVTTRSYLVRPAGADTGATYSDANVSLSTNSAKTVAVDANALSINQPVIAGQKETHAATDDPSDPTAAARTGQLLLFLSDDTKAVTGAGVMLEASLLNLSAELGKGTFDLKSNVASLLLNGSKTATIDNTARTGPLTAFTLGVQDIATTGTASSSATVPASSLTDNNQTFATNQHAGRKIEITGGTGAGQIATITSNDAHKIIIASAWTTAPDSTSTYRIGENKDLRAGNVTLRTGGDLNAAAINVTGNLVLSSESVGAKQAITLLNSSGQNILLRADGLTITNALTTPGVNVVLQPFTTSNVIGIHNSAVGVGATNYSSALLNQFNPQANITIGGDDIDITANPVFAPGTTVGITGTPRQTGNVFIGNDGTFDLGTRNLYVSTIGNIVADNIGSVNNLALVAGSAGGITLNALNSTGTNLLFKADALSLPSAAANYTTAAGVNVTLQPYTLTNTVGVHNAVDYHTNSVGNATAGSNLITVNSTSGFTVGNAIDVLGAGAGGGTLSTTIAALGPLVTLGANAAIAVNNVTVTIIPLFGGPVTTTGTISAGSGTLIVASNAGIHVGDTIQIAGAGVGNTVLSTTVSALPTSSGMLISTALTTATNTLVGLTSTKQTINTNYSLDLLNKFNPTAAITISGTAVSSGPSNTLTGNIHTGSDSVTGVTPFDIGTRTLTVSTTGTIFTHTAASIATASSGTSGVVPAGTATWAPGATPTPGNGVVPGGGGTSGTGSSGTGGSGSSSGSGSGGPGTAGPSSDPTGGATGSATGTTPTTTPSSPGGGTTTPGGTTPTGPTSGTLPTPTTDPGDPGVVVIAYTPDPDPTTPPDPVAVDPGSTPPDPTDPTTPVGPIAVDPGTLPPDDPSTPTGPVASDPGTTTPPDPTGPTIPTGPIAGDPGTGTSTPPDPTDPTTPTGPIAGDPGTLTPDPTDPTAPTGPIAGDPGTTPTDPTDPGTPTGPITGGPGTTTPDPSDPTTPTGPLAGDPGSSAPDPSDPSTPTGPVAGDPGTTTPGSSDPTTPGGPIAGDPGSTSPGTTGDPGSLPGDPGTTPPGSTTGGPTTVAGDPGSTSGDPGTTPGSTTPGSTDPSAPAGPVAGGPGSSTPGSTDPGTSSTDGTGTSTASTGATGSTDPGGSTTSGSGTSTASTGGSTDPGGSTTGGSGTSTASTGSTGGTTGSTDPGGSTTGSSGTSTASTGSTGGSADPSGSTTGGSGTSTASTGSTGGTTGSTDPGGSTTGSSGTSTASTGSTGGSTDPGGSTTGGSGTSTASTGSTGGTTGSTDPGGSTTSGSGTSTASTGSTGGSTDPGGSTTGGSGTSTASTDSTGGTTGSAGGSTDPSGSTTGGSGTSTASTSSTGGTQGSSSGSANSNTAGTTTASTDSANGAGGNTSADGKTNESSNQATVNCPPGTSGAASSSGGGAAGPCVAIGVAAGSAKPPATKPVVTARIPATPDSTGNGAAPKEASSSAAISAKSAITAPAAKPAIAPLAAAQKTPASAAVDTGRNASNATAPLLAVQGDGVNLYREGRGKGPGTPLR